MRRVRSFVALVVLAGILLAGATTAQADSRALGFVLVNSKKQIVGSGDLFLDDMYMLRGKWDVVRTPRPDLNPNKKGEEGLMVYQEQRALVGGTNVASKVEGARTTWFGYRGLGGTMVRKMNLWFTHATEFSLKQGQPNYQIRQYLDVEELPIIWHPKRGNLIYLNPDDYPVGTYHLATQVRYWKGREWSEWYLLFIRFLGTASNQAGTDIHGMQVAIKDAPRIFDTSDPANDALVAEMMAEDMGFSVTGKVGSVAGGVINLANRPYTPPVENDRASLPAGLPGQNGLHRLSPEQVAALQGFAQGVTGGLTAVEAEWITVKETRSTKDGREIYLIAARQESVVTTHYKGFAPQSQRLKRGETWEVLRSAKYPIEKIVVQTADGERVYNPNGVRRQ